MSFPCFTMVHYCCNFPALSLSPLLSPPPSSLSLPLSSYIFLSILSPSLSFYLPPSFPLLNGYYEKEQNLRNLVCILGKKTESALAAALQVSICKILPRGAGKIDPYEVIAHWPSSRAISTHFSLRGRSIGDARAECTGQHFSPGHTLCRIMTIEEVLCLLFLRAGRGSSGESPSCRGDVCDTNPQM